MNGALYAVPVVIVALFALEHLFPMRTALFGTSVRMFETPELNCLGDVHGRDRGAACEIRDRPRHFQYAVIRTRR